MEEMQEVKFPQESVSEALRWELDALKAEYPEITSAAVVSSDGLLMAVRPEGSADERLAAMSAFLLNSARKTGDGMGWSGLDYLLVNHPEGYLLVAEAGKATITLTTSPRAKLGLLLYDIKEASKRVKQKLEGD